MNVGTITNDIVGGVREVKVHQKLKLLGFSQAGKGGDKVGDHLEQVEGIILGLKLARLNFGDIKDAEDDIKDQIATRVHDFEKGKLILAQRRLAEKIDGREKAMQGGS